MAGPLDAVHESAAPLNPASLGSRGVLTPDDTLAALKELAAGLVSYPLEEMKPESRLRDDLGLDSADLMVLLVQLEERFGSFLDEAKAFDARTLGEAASQLHAVLTRARASS